MKRLAGTTFAAYAFCDSQTFLKKGLFSASALANSSQVLRKARLISGGVVNSLTLCLVTNSWMA